MKALWIAERFPPDAGGAAASAGRQVRGLAEHLERLDVLRLTSELRPGRVESREWDGAAVHRVGAAREADESLQLLFQAGRNLLEAHRHDLLHGFYAVHAGYVAATLARLAGRPAVVSLRGNDLDRAMFHGPRLPFLLWTLERSHALVGVSREILDKVRALTGREDGLHHVPNGVDGRIFRPEAARPEAPELAGASRPYLAFAGELRLKKGLPILEDLAARLAQEPTGTLFWVGGVRREERAEVEAWRRHEPAAAARVREIPYRSDPIRLAGLLAAMDACIFPSLWEGMPNALLEAMACARPVVASAAGAIPEVVEPERTGVLVPASQLDAFAEATLALLARPPAEREQMGAAARERVLRDYTPEAERRALMDVYASLVR